MPQQQTNEVIVIVIKANIKIYTKIILSEASNKSESSVSLLSDSVAGIFSFDTLLVGTILGSDTSNGGYDSNGENVGFWVGANVGYSVGIHVGFLDGP